MDTGYARELAIGEKFYRANDEMVYKRITFEGKNEVLFRCVKNIVALRGPNDVAFIPLDEGVVGY